MPQLSLCRDFGERAAEEGTTHPLRSCSSLDISRWEEKKIPFRTDLPLTLRDKAMCRHLPLKSYGWNHGHKITNGRG